MSMAQRGKAQIDLVRTLKVSFSAINGIQRNGPNAPSSLFIWPSMSPKGLSAGRTSPISFFAELRMKAMGFGIHFQTILENQCGFDQDPVMFVEA